MTLRVQAKRIILLAWPIVITQLALSGMVTIDTIMAADFASIDMAALGTSLGIWHPISLFTLGVITVFSPILSRDFGSRNKANSNIHFSNALLITFGLSIFSVLLMLGKTPLLNLLDLEPNMLIIMHEYLFYLMLSLPGFCFLILFRTLNEAMGNTRLIMYLQIGALILNIPLNAIFIHGYAGIEAMGGAGAGLATALINYVMLFVLMYISFRKSNCQFYINDLTYAHISRAKITEFLKLGLPIGITLFFEIALFGAIALAIGTYGVDAAAAHQIAISFASNMYMLPLSLSIATSVVIGQLIGEEQPNAAITAAKSGILLALSIAVITASVTLFGRQYVSLLYTNDPDVIAVALALLIWAAVFQLSDAIQSVTLGALRGFKDTHIPMVYTLISYWLIGFPIGWLLAETTLLTSQPLGLHGYWAGLLISLTSAAILLSQRLFKIIKHNQHLLINTEYSLR
ncbi:MATE family efflux transporter [Algibacillus agarilyticus]|uniref:MATE family efflux transporter n=1 Tax=Algibacillus agarilyticus TaxID=2234133 RepID=UPI000DD014AA|nr:MATE family efflux transporter [Algibacillus agarilyticus]